MADTTIVDNNMTDLETTAAERVLRDRYRALAEIARLAAERAAALRFPADGWRTIESAPKDGSDFLVCLWGTTMAVVSYKAPENNAIPAYCWYTLDGPSYHRDAPTHWQPLPSPPAEEKTP
jgi:hypothetical protein